LLGDAGATTVIDWTQYAVSDPRLDLSWTLLLVDSSDRTDWSDAILAAYEAKRGRQSDLEVFAVAAAAKRLFASFVALTAGPEALGMRADAAEEIRAHLPALARVYRTLLEGCDIAIPEVESLLSGG
jgi:aminoglycoside phosphotransferase (APT) family kinase protein